VALDSCLGCKSCRSECPTHTDMAAYKAEFLSHYHEKKPRALGAALMGRIGEWAPLASRFAGFANAVSPFGKSLAGVASGRSLPRFQKPYRATFAPGGQQGERVVLFDDTFNNHFRPQTARAAQKLLETAGCAVELPREHVCCGRPYYDTGMLDRAKIALDRVLDVLEPGVPVVFLEPGCLSVLRDELKQLFPRDARVTRLRAFSLSEFLLERNFKPQREASVLVHSHCHQKAMWGAKSDLELLKAAGCTVSAPDTGCCGMSGSFGYRAEHYETSKRIAGLALLPALSASPDAAVVACGFSCREQIEDLGRRPTLHIADLLAG
jgi:Fe-S oxidoreductase